MVRMRQPSTNDWLVQPSMAFNKTSLVVVGWCCKNIPGEPERAAIIDLYGSCIYNVFAPGISIRQYGDG